MVLENIGQKETKVAFYDINYVNSIRTAWMCLTNCECLSFLRLALLSKDFSLYHSSFVIDLT